MENLRNFLFFDLEYNPGTEKVREYGYILGDEQVRTNNPAKLEEAALKAEFIVGHNVLRHDAPILRRYFSIDFPNVKALDTLMLSSLLFPRKPYHKLRKEYLQNADEPSNPLKDAELCKDLLKACVEKWETFPWQLRCLLYQFLKNEPGFAPFFKLVEIPERKVLLAKLPEIRDWFKRQYAKVICLHQDFENEWDAYRAEWCFLLTLFYEEGPSDFVPHWVRYQYPHLENILHRRRLVPCGVPQCPYCSEQLNATKQLKKWFGFDNFRAFNGEKVPLQQQVVEAAMRGESLLAVFPTGGGKSMTFQLPALIAGTQIGALTVVISPIVALMKDQVDVLERRRQIGDAAYLNSMLSPAERRDVLAKVASGEKNILYISPESLRSNTMFNLLKFRRIERFVIDEAHCFSGWGHDFRVDYLYLADFIKDLQKAKNLETPIPISCFTATAKKSVVDDICNYFKERLNLELVKFISPAKRTNLTYKVVQASESPNERRKQLVNVLRDYAGPKIIYASKVKTTETLSEELHQRGFASACYNGKMESEKKMTIQDQFQSGEVDTMVATTAFGMGVDKDNVELVAHYEISSTLENYVQEAGRAGRDPKLQANCVALFNPKDLNTNFQILQQSKLSAQEISAVWRILKKMAGNQNRLIMSALEIADQCGWTEKEVDASVNATKVKLAILVLEEQGFLKRKRNRTQMYGSSISVESAEQAREIIGTDKVDVPGTIEATAYRIIRHIITKRWTQSPECALDELTVNLGLKREEANDGLRLLRSLHLLNEEDDWSAKLQRKGHDTPRSLLNAASNLQKELLNACEGKGVNDRFVLDMTRLNSQLNQRTESVGASTSRRNLFIFRGILRYWAHESVAEIHLVEAGHQVYQIEFLVDPDSVKENLEKQWKLFDKVIEVLTEMQKEQTSQNGNVVWFSLNGLLQRMYGEKAIGRMEMQKQVEYALLFLHLIGSITLDHGLVVFYTGLVMELNPEARQRNFTAKEFEMLNAHYQHKAESIHIVGEYARMMLEDEKAAQQLLDDYFVMDIADFRLKYMRGIALTESVSDELKHKIENVNDEQRKVIRSRKKHILVGAGPGSGKTHLLVHKVASLLWIEEAKPDSILCLTYTRAACRELKKRLFDLAGPLAAKVTITTFHSLAFSILGVQGNKKLLENADEVVTKAAELLESGEDVGVGAPSVILVDEFQDLSAGEYRLLHALYDLGEKEPRVIVVGDDDQSIFAFRGSSSEYFQKFADEFPNTEKFYLTTNYRSVAGVVRANAKLLNLMTDRVKQGSQQHAIKQNGAELAFYEEPNKATAAFAAAEILAKKFSENPEESYCILTHDNAEAFLAAAKLEECQIPYRLLKGRDKDKCPIGKTREVLGFCKVIQEDPRVGKHPWSAKEFKELAEAYKAAHSAESSFELLNALIDDFLEAETACGDDEITLGDFNQYLGEVSYSDFATKNMGAVSIGTMHSAKGLEWDNVILALGSWALKDTDEKKAQENYRLLYVAATRAKRCLIVLGDEPMLPSDWLNLFARRGKIKDVKIPKVLHIETGLGDVSLGQYLKKNDAGDVYVERLQAALENAPLGMDLAMEQNVKNGNYCVKQDSVYWAWFAKEFSGGLVKSLAKNVLVPQKASLSQVVRWTSEEGQETWVPLFRVEFGKR
ncbi:MAG: RecQ family ATP-dependent DNA helicase [Fibrobacter sp.]|nr:RecQ family ATP-dependent DNA helicase [Fibrobacter sp.]